MRRLDYSSNSDNWFFNENNWTFFTKELTPFIKNKIIINSEAYDYFSKFFNYIDSFFNYNTINFHVLPLSYNDLYLLNKCSSLQLNFVIFDQITNFFHNFQYFDLNNTLLSNSAVDTVLMQFFNPWIHNIFIFLFIFIFLLKYHLDYGSNYEKDRSFFGILYEEFVLTWVNFAGIKFESYEEAICILILWPWCIFLVFTHIFTVESNETFFIFVEWGVPVIYGYLILLESIWLFGVHFFVYLNGSRGRRILTITLIEDIVNFMILLARVTLQMVRGIICGLYHDFFREVTEYLIDTWDIYWYYASVELPFCKNNYLTDFSLFFIDWYIFAFLLLFIYIILFLQLLFLLIAVWLFCRCWFISFKHINNIYKSYETGDQGNTRESNLTNNRVNILT